jgi:hypothetical protein
MGLARKAAKICAGDSKPLPVAESLVARPGEMFFSPEGTPPRSPIPVADQGKAQPKT